MRRVRVYPKTIRNYKPLVSPELYEQLFDLAKNLKGLRVLHISSEAERGSVAEVLKSEIPLMQDLGLEVSWQVMTVEPDFKRAVREMEKAFGGTNGKLTAKVRKTYEQTCAYNAHLIKKERWDVVIAHDLGSLAVPYYMDLEGAVAVWRCHDQFMAASQPVWTYLKQFLDDYEAAVFCSKELIPSDLPIKKRFVAPLGIDPLSPKNKAIGNIKARKILEKLGLDTRRPIIAQVASFDTSKDFVGIVGAYLGVKKRFPEVQLALAGNLDEVYEESSKLFEVLKKQTANYKDIKLLKNLSDEQVNALQTVSQIIIQKPVCQGFGLAVSEAMYKEKAVIGSAVGGIKLQIIDGKNGFLVDSPALCAQRIAELLEDTQLKVRMSRAGKQIAAKYFLTPRLLRDDLLVLSKLETKENVAKVGQLF